MGTDNKPKLSFEDQKKVVEAVKVQNAQSDTSKYTNEQQRAVAAAETIMGNTDNKTEVDEIKKILNDFVSILTKDEGKRSEDEKKKLKADADLLNKYSELITKHLGGKLPKDVTDKASSGNGDDKPFWKNPWFIGGMILLLIVVVGGV